MNWLDIVLVCLAGIGLVKGLFDGVIKQVVSLMVLVAATFFCTKAAVWVRGYIVAMGWFPEEAVTIVSYVAGFALIMGVMMPAGEIVHRVIGMTPLGLLNHIAGGVFGICLMTLSLSLLLNVLEMVDRRSALIPRELKMESRFYAPVKEIIPTIYPADLFSWKE